MAEEQEEVPETQEVENEPPPPEDATADPDPEAPTAERQSPTTMVPEREKSLTERDRRSTLSNFPLTNSEVLTELKEADKNAINTVKLIESLRADIAQYQQKENMTEEDVKNLQGLHDELMAKLSEFESISRNVQRLLGLADVSSSQLGPLTPFTSEMSSPDQRGQRSSYQRDSLKQNKMNLQDLQQNLPRIVICGRRHDNDVPKIIVCDGQPKKDETPIRQMENNRKQSDQERQSSNQESSGKAQTFGPKSEQAQLKKDKDLEAMQLQISELQRRMSSMSKENAKLHKKLACKTPQTQTQTCKKELCQKMCQSAVPDGDQNCSSGVNKDLEKQIEVMESVVASMKSEVCNVQSQRKSLISQQQMLQCAFSHQAGCKKEMALQHQQGYETSPCTKLLENQLRELNEQYCRLECEFKEKVKEISSLRTELKANEKVIEQVSERYYLAEAKAQDIFEQMKMMDLGKREEMMDQAEYTDMKQKSILAQQNWRETQQELEALQIYLEDRDSEIEFYRNKYLKTQQDLEEQKKYVEKLHLQSCEVKEQLLIEIQQYKDQIQEKVCELLPLPEKLKCAELKMTLYQQNIEELSKELNEMRELLTAKANIAFERDQLIVELEKKEMRIQELQKENIDHMAVLSRFEDLTLQNEWLYEEKVHEVTQLNAQLTTLREECARICANLKENSEATKLRFMERISTMEKELVCSRAAASAAAKQRDEIQNQMEQQVIHLEESFRQAQSTITVLQEKVCFLKTTTSR